MSETDAQIISLTQNVHIAFCLPLRFYHGELFKNPIMFVVFYIMLRNDEGTTTLIIQESDLQEIQDGTVTTVIDSEGTAVPLEGVMVEEGSLQIPEEGTVIITDDNQVYEQHVSWTLVESARAILKKTSVSGVAAGWFIKVQMGTFFSFLQK